MNFPHTGGNGCILLRIFKLKCNLFPQVNNILIVNLAVSDLLLCCVVVPTTLLINVTKRWAGPKIPIFCQVCSLVMFSPAPSFSKEQEEFKTLKLGNAVDYNESEHTCGLAFWNAICYDVFCVNIDDRRNRN